MTVLDRLLVGLDPGRVRDNYFFERLGEAMPQAFEPQPRHSTALAV